MEFAETWKAVILLDEADASLAEWGDVDMLRNAVASIFLRHLEYYQGIMLLTTNRPHSFDSAFHSRIHFSFNYEPLEVQARVSIWGTFPDRVKATISVEVMLQEGDLNALENMELNERQIENTVSMTQAVASEKKEVITLDTIRLAAGFVKISSSKTSEVSQASPI
ncbi:putative AAA family ATPase [Rosellinia necatrix]|uniref:Putative AAA family ATPase n=1 Tax=Rosellinia necatrix TaxID=77044 RepID=A0A1S8A6F7_ROSNE|nr:putative AAA family ATPase [Rosellinia necatrix]